MPVKLNLCPLRAFLSLFTFFLLCLFCWLWIFRHMQRWAIIRKRRGNLNVGINSTSSQLSEARRAAHHAMSLALDMPVKNFTAARPGSPLSIFFYFKFIEVTDIKKNNNY